MCVCFFFTIIIFFFLRHTHQSKDTIVLLLKELFFLVLFIPFLYCDEWTDGSDCDESVLSFYTAPLLNLIQIHFCLLSIRLINSLVIQFMSKEDTSE